MYYRRPLSEVSDGGRFFTQFVIKFATKDVENMTRVYYNTYILIYYLKAWMNKGSENMRLKELRKNSKLTQEQIAAYLGVDQSMVTKLENGTRSLNVTLINKICDLFGCSEEYLMGKDDDHIPLNFAFRSNGIMAEDLESISAVNKIAMNIRFMNEKLRG